MRHSINEYTFHRNLFTYYGWAPKSQSNSNLSYQFTSMFGFWQVMIITFNDIKLHDWLFVQKKYNEKNYWIYIRVSRFVSIDSSASCSRIRLSRIWTTFCYTRGTYVRIAWIANNNRARNSTQVTQILSADWGISKLSSEYRESEGRHWYFLLTDKWWGHGLPAGCVSVVCTCGLWVVCVF